MPVSFDRGHKAIHVFRGSHKFCGQFPIPEIVQKILNVANIGRGRNSDDKLIGNAFNNHVLKFLAKV